MLARPRDSPALHLAIGSALGGEAGARLAGKTAVPTSPDTLLRRVKQAGPLIRRGPRDSSASTTGPGARGNATAPSSSTSRRARGNQIGDGVLIGPCVLIWSQNHCYEERDLPIREQGYKRSQVTVEDDVWIGARAIILPGVRLSRGTVVAAGAVVTRLTDCYSIVAGVPAKPMGLRRSRSRHPESNEKRPGAEGALGPQVS